MDLDDPVDFNGRNNTKALIRSRWLGRELGEKEPTAADLLLFPLPDVLRRTDLSSKDFEHVTWCMAYREIL